MIKNTLILLLSITNLALFVSLTHQQKEWDQLVKADEKLKASHLELAKQTWINGFLHGQKSQLIGDLPDPTDLSLHFYETKWETSEVRSSWQ